MPRTYSPEIKAQVIAEWKAGKSLGGCARAFDMPLSTVALWVHDHERLAVSLQQPKMEPYNLDLMAIQLVDGSVNAVSRIHGVTKDEVWLKRQNAADLAVLLGVISDKLYRLLEAIQPQRTDRGAVIPAGAGEDS